MDAVTEGFTSLPVIAFIRPFAHSSAHMGRLPRVFGGNPTARIASTSASRRAHAYARARARAWSLDTLQMFPALSLSLENAASLGGDFLYPSLPVRLHQQIYKRTTDSMRGAVFFSTNVTEGFNASIYLKQARCMAIR